MGQDFSMMRPAPPQGAFVYVIESDECCTTEPLTGRHWDDQMQKPSFVQMSASDWSSFVGTVGSHVKGYRKEAWGSIILIASILLSMILFHPVIGVVGGSISGFRDRRRLETCAAAVRPDTGTPEKDATYLEWGEYGRACSAGCKYADSQVMLSLRGMNASNASLPPGAVAPPPPPSCPTHGQLYVATNYSNVTTRARHDMHANDGHFVNDECPACTIRHHDPCFAMVQLGGYDHDIGKKEWFSCCGAWSYHSHCSDAEKEQLKKLRCTEAEGTDECPNEAVDWEEVEGAAGFGVAMLLMLCVGGVGVAGGISWGCMSRSRNEQIDKKIDAYLRSVSGERSGATFTLIRAWTGPCKPKHARTYRALCIAPGGGGGMVAPAPGGGGYPQPPGGYAPAGYGGIAMATPASVAVTTMQVTVPAGMKAGDMIAIVGPNGQQFNLSIPPGVAPGQAFVAQLPVAPTPTVVAGTVVSSTGMPSA